VKALLIATLALALPAMTEETTLGAGVTIKDVTPIASITANPNDYVGKIIRVDGIATAVCEQMGCWMAVAASDAKDAPTIRIKVEEGKVVIPVTAKGKQVSAEGTFQAVGATDEASKESQAATKLDAKAFTDYQLKATGAIIK
jgi:flagellar hook assembly protein FlgD